MMNHSINHTGSTRTRIIETCRTGLCAGFAVGSGLVVAWILIRIIVEQAATAAAQQTLSGLTLAALAGLLICYQLHTTSGIRRAGHHFYRWLGEGEVEVDG